MEEFKNVVRFISLLSDDIRSNITRTINTQGSKVIVIGSTKDTVMSLLGEVVGLLSIDKRIDVLHIGLDGGLGLSKIGKGFMPIRGLADLSVVGENSLVVTNLEPVTAHEGVLKGIITDSNLALLGGVILPRNLKVWDRTITDIVRDLNSSTFNCELCSKPQDILVVYIERKEMEYIVRTELVRC